ncbi:DUF5000 domain-containing lipoprotein [Mucilaginibacter paludis]|uniref:DUF4959 domain-containing protein n=1 Tax=Mucilaginibacter paludis DSM 18603 TaxID=714943 RepID=H1Y956_9SPHI|nr:DUF5000 domain-containing lipoprotein [Mucilaginibacter paludis]EHQ29094.1 hypothetical protein Mucpa_5015 [Mucilaginibacter paludis DSM 18603]
MKNINIYGLKFLLYGLLLMVIVSCKRDDGFNAPVSTDLTKPGVVTNIKVTNFNGGAYITYSLPNSPNLLYVQADYRINGSTTRQTKASYYTDTVTVDGFAKSQDYEVTLHAVSRANVMSDAVVVHVHPLTPVYLMVKPTALLSADFGGVNISALNPLKKPIGLILIAIDPSTKGYEIVDQHYTNQDTSNYSIRGYNTTPRKFGVYVTDQFGNVSDTTFATITPIFETMLDKGKFFKYLTATDSPIGYGWELPYLWDGKTDGYSNGWHTLPGAPAPMQCTFGLGVNAKLSRFILWERPNEFSFSHANPKDFTLWGSAKASPADVLLPKSSPIGTVVGDWTNLGNYRYPDPPSGLPPGLAANNPSDQAFVLAGVNFNVSITSPAVRVLRIDVADTWSGGDYAHLMEISLYGNPQ